MISPITASKRATVCATDKRDMQLKLRSSSSLDWLITTNVKNYCQKIACIWLEKFFAILSLGNAKNETYEMYKETVFQKGRCVTYWYVQNKLQPSRNGRLF
jgi:hypothetical protein